MSIASSDTQRVVLVVDGDPIMRELVRKVCEMQGLEMREVETTAAARNAIALAVPLAVLCSSMISDGDGIAFARELRVLLPAPTLVVIVMAAGDEREAEAQAAGVSVVLSHPSNSAALLSAMRSIARARTAGPDSLVPPRLLIVDEDSYLSAVLKRGLSSTFDVTVVDSGSGALAEIRGRGEPDAVLAELRLVDMTAQDFHTALGELHPGLTERIVFMTGGFVSEAMHTFLALVPGRWIYKPFPLGTVRTLISDVVERRKANSSN